MPAGGDPAASVTAAGPGATIRLSPGTYTLTSPIVPLTGQTIVGEGARLYGGITLAGWTRDGDDWVTTDSRIETTARRAGHVQCAIEGTDDCSLPEQMWIDGQRQERVFTRSGVLPGTWYLDNPGLDTTSTTRHPD